MLIAFFFTFRHNQASSFFVSSVCCKLNYQAADFSLIFTQWYLSFLLLFANKSQINDFYLWTLLKIRVSRSQPSPHHCVSTGERSGCNYYNMAIEERNSQDCLYFFIQIITILVEAKLRLQKG